MSSNVNNHDYGGGGGGGGDDGGFTDLFLLSLLLVEMTKGVTHPSISISCPPIAKVRLQYDETSYCAPPTTVSSDEQDDDIPLGLV